MDELECYRNLTRLDEQRDAVELALNSFVAASNDLLTAFVNAANYPSDMKLVNELNHELRRFSSSWTQLDDSVTTWDNTMRKFRKEVLNTVQQRIRRDKTLKDLQTACDPIVVYAEWSEGEVKPLRGLLEVWRNYGDFVVSYAEAWGDTRVGY